MPRGHKRPKHAGTNDAVNEKNGFPAADIYHLATTASLSLLRSAALSELRTSGFLDLFQREDEVSMGTDDIDGET